MGIATVVVGTDGSDTAAKAIREAEGIAKRNSATLHIVSVYKRSVAGVVGAASLESASFGALPLTEHVDDAAREAAETYLSRIADRIDGVPVKTAAICGEPSEQIVAYADAVGADAIVVGNKGMTGIRRLLGSVPNRVAHKATCSVFVVKTT